MSLPDKLNSEQDSNGQFRDKTGTPIPEIRIGGVIYVGYTEADRPYIEEQHRISRLAAEMSMHPLFGDPIWDGSW